MPDPFKSPGEILKEFRQANNESKPRSTQGVTSDIEFVSDYQNAYVERRTLKVVDGLIVAVSEPRREDRKGSL